MAEPKPKASKRERSLRVANKRTNKAITIISSLKSLTSANYDVKPEELTQISEAVSDAVVELQTAYETGDSGFSLS